MRRNAGKAIAEAAKKCDRLAERALDTVFETTYRIVVSKKISEEDVKPDAHNLTCLAFTYAVCAPLAVSAWALRQAAALTSSPDED